MGRDKDSQTDGQIKKILRERERFDDKVISVDNYEK